VKILLITGFFPPEIGSASHLFYELGQSLVTRGHEVDVVTTFPRRWKIGESATYRTRGIIAKEKADGMRVLRVRSTSTPRDSLFAAGLEHLALPVSLLLGGFLTGRPDVILIFSPPLPLGATTWLLSRIVKAPFVVNIQDLYPQAVIDLGLLRNGLLIRVFRAIERLVYRKADRLTVHSDGNRQYVISKGASPEKVTVIHNWADTDKIKPSVKMNEFRHGNGLDSRFVVSYAGIMSYSQDLETIVQAAALLREERDILFLLVGNGVQKERLVTEAKELGLENVVFLPFQPRERYPQVLAASDACFVTLEKDKVSTPVVPGKLHSIMASGRPVVASVPLDGDTPKIVRAARCGVCVEPGNPQMLAEAVKELHQNPALAEEMGDNGRRYSEEHFSLETATQRYLDLFNELCSK